jgi:hypothetical protein
VKNIKDPKRRRRCWTKNKEMTQRYPSSPSIDQCPQLQHAKPWRSGIAMS